MSVKRRPCAVVIGGTRGIGLEISRHFLNRGFNVAICGRDKTRTFDVCQTLRKQTNSKIIGLAINATDVDECREFADEVKRRFDYADVLVTNAAIFGPVGYTMNLNLETWIGAIEANALSMMVPIREFEGQLKNSSLSRILTMSGAGLGGSNPIKNASAYFASKALTVALVEALGYELQPSGISINAIAPGFFPTGFMDEAARVGPDIAGQDLYKDAVNMDQSGLTSSLRNLTELIDHLVAEESSGITGRVFSARWDDPNLISRSKSDVDLYRLRRIDNDLFQSRDV